MVWKACAPEGKWGDYRIEKFTVTEQQASLFNTSLLFSGQGSRAIEPGQYTKLVRGRVLIMSDTPAEERDHQEAIYQARGEVLINGLGLGLVTVEVLKKSTVNKVTVNEISREVVSLVAPHLPDSDGKLVVNVGADAFSWKPKKGEKFDVIWHDIWSVYSDDVYEESKKLHRRYAHWLKPGGWQGSWGRGFVRRR